MKNQGQVQNQGLVQKKKNTPIKKNQLSPGSKGGGRGKGKVVKSVRRPIQKASATRSPKNAPQTKAVKIIQPTKGKMQLNASPQVLTSCVYRIFHTV